MIERGRAPEYFKTEFVQMANQKLSDFYYSTNRQQKRYDFPLNKKFDEEVKEYLREEFYDKCGYCDRHIGDTGVVDRFRPCSGVREEHEFHQDLYWWLTFDWKNLIYSCPECSQYKANYFPVNGPRALSAQDGIQEEFYLFFYPGKDNPDELFNYDREGNVSSALHSLDDPTIELLRLNRNSLKTGRLAAMEDVRKLIKEAVDGAADAKRLLHEIDTANPVFDFLSCRRRMLYWEIQQYPKLSGLLGIEVDHMWFDDGVQEYFDDSLPDGVVADDYFPIEQIRIRNFRGITDLTIDFKPDAPGGKSWLFLLGENGAGKSSILQAIALGLQADHSLMTPQLVRNLIRKGQEEAEIIIKERDSDNIIRTTLQREDGEVTQEGKFASFLFGYGSLRLSSEEAEESREWDLRRVSYDNLFHSVRPLNDITDWLKVTHEQEQELFNRIAYSIKQLLPHDFYDNELTIVDGEIVFKNSEKSFASLSDGFKSTIILAIDIMMKLSSANADMDKLSGLVLIDELGNQLHPRWQMRIVRQLRKVFTNLNFIVSTHHPLCLRGSEEGEILLLKQSGSDIAAVTDLPDPAAMQVDQLLTSEFFGLNSLIDPEMEAIWNRYYELLAKQSLTREEREELDSLKDGLKEKKHLGSTLRDELMYAVIDSLLATRVHTLTREELKRETIKRVAEAWKKINIRKYD